MDSNLLNNLTSIIDTFTVPATLVSLKQNKILVSNSQILRSYGLNFWEELDIEILGLDDSENCSCFLKIIKEDPSVKLEVCPLDEASFELLPYSKEIVIIHELSAWQISQKSFNNSSQDKSFPPPKPFHLTYRYDITTGACIFSKPELLYSRGFVSKDIPIEEVSWKELIFEDDIPIFENVLNKSGKEKFKIRYRIKRLNGDLIKVCDYCSYSSDSPNLLLGGVINEEKNSEEKLAAERLVLVGRLVGGMIHDFRNLLCGILNMLEWCVSKEENNVEVNSALQNTITYTDRATSLINGVLNVCSGQEGDTMGVIYFSELLTNIENMIRRIIPSSIKLTIDIEPNLPPIYGKINTLSDMLLNLCINAKDALESVGDKLDISAKLETNIDENGSKQQYITLVVKDNGVGMSKEDCREVFNAFYSTKESGAGLGLWMVKEAIRRFNGELKLDSKLGKGTRFQIMFPVMELTLQNKRETKIVKNKEINSSYKYRLKEKKTALLIEDDPLIRLGVSTWFEEFGFTLLVAENGPQGLDLFIKNQNEIEIVIQDYVLPGIMGDELLKKFVKIKPNIPVIVTTGNSDSNRIENFMSEGAYSVMAKPFKIEEMTQLIIEIFGKGK